MDSVQQQNQEKQNIELTQNEEHKGKKNKKSKEVHGSLTYPVNKLQGQDKQKSINNISERYDLTIEDLESITTALQQRVFAEEIEVLEKIGDEEAILKKLQTDSKQGIITQNKHFRESFFGTNKKEPKELESIWQIFLGAMDDFTLQILCVASVISIIVGSVTGEHPELDWIEGFAIMIAVFISSGLTTLNDYQKQQQFAVLHSVAEARKMVNCIRDGQLHCMHQSELLVGDVVMVNNGMEVPADGILIQSAEITADESAMTGETEPMKKDIILKCVHFRNTIIADGGKKYASAHEVPSPIMLSGTRVLSGDGKMVIIAVGKYSAIGKIQNLLEQEEESATPLQQKLESIAEDIGKFGLVSALVILIVLIIRWCVQQSELDASQRWSKAGSDIVSYLIIAITVVVVAIPEGLPLAVTLSLAYSVKKMLYDKNLVRQLKSCEIMGGANAICSDKTGTLTQNKMSLQQIWNQKEIVIDTYAQKLNLDTYVPKTVQSLIATNIIANSNATLYPEESGSATDIALLKFIDKCGFEIQKTRDSTDIIQFFPFSSSRKRMSVIVNENGKKVMYIKGASEIILESCDKFLQFDGNNVSLDVNQKSLIEAAIAKMANNALRTIIIAKKDLSGSENLEEKDSKGVFKVESSQFTMFALLGIKDILRQEVPGAIEQCKRSGVRVRMVTGDNLLTARAIALECGIINPDNKDSLVMNGQDFMNLVGGVICNNCKTKLCECPLDEKKAALLKKEVRKDTIANGEEFDKIIDRLDVLSRSRPEDKYALVTGLIERGNVVAVTGDGTNDAPALKKADVGFAMGIAGTQVAREACDIILLDDNFSSIVKAIVWGRNVYDSIKKFLQFQLTVNLSAVILTLIGAVTTKEQILTAVQMLWVNLIMDTLGSLALATEPPSQALLDRKPHSRNEYIVTKKMFKHIIMQAVWQLSVLFFFTFSGELWIKEYYTDDLDIKIAANIANNQQFQITKGSMVPWSWSFKYSDYNNKFIRSGRPYYISTAGEDYSKNLKASIGPSRHYTMVFNVFVMMQIFNFICARKLKDEFNIFENIHKSRLFVIIVVFILFLQAILITWGGQALNCYNNRSSTFGGGGLDIIQWLICCGFGSTIIIINFCLKFLNEDKICPQRGNKESDPLKRTGILSLKKSSRQMQRSISIKKN